LERAPAAVLGIHPPTRKKARHVMIGGFLGAGKTTAVSRLARHLQAQGLRVGLITNDQSHGLVDTTIVTAKGYPVVQREQLQFLEERFYNNPRPFYGFEQEGAVLREMAALFGPEKGVTPGSDSVPVVIPRGEINVARIEDKRIVLEGGNAIEASQTDVASADKSPIPPGNVRIGRTDLEAIKPNLTPGMRVYFY